MTSDIEIDLTNVTDTIPKSVRMFDPSYVTRYAIVCKAILAVENEIGRKLKILDIGGYNGAAQVLLPGHDITILDVIKDSKAKNYVQYNGGKMPFKAQSFDAVISCDTLEHVRPEERDEFISEMGRVTKEFLVLGAPFATPGVAEAEQRSDIFYQGLTNEQSYIWLKEHREFGLPKTNWFEEAIVKIGFTFSRFSHTSIDLWEIMLRTSFFLAGNIKPVDPRTANKLNRSNEKYLQECTFYDFPETGYRTFYIGSRHYKINIKLPEYDRQTIDVFINQQFHTTGECLQRLTNSLGVKQEELLLASKEVNRLNSENMNLRQQLEAIHRSKAYALAIQIRNIRHLIG